MVIVGNVGNIQASAWWSVGFSAVAVLLSLWLPGAQRAPQTSRDSAPDQRADPAAAQQQQAPRAAVRD